MKQHLAIPRIDGVRLQELVEVYRPFAPKSVRDLISDKELYFVLLELRERRGLPRISK